MPAPVHAVGDRSGKSVLPTCKKIALVGNPNVGKSVIFNALTGSDADVSNYPGTTIDVARGHLEGDELIDTPGVYGVSSFNDEEKVARSGILSADVIVNIVSALSLDRDLFLTLQLIDMGKPLLLVLNQCDEAAARGLTIDTPLLSELLGVPIVRCVAVRNEGIGDITTHLHEAALGHANPVTLSHIDQLEAVRLDQARKVLLLEGDDTTATECGVTGHNLRAEIYRSRRQLVNRIVAESVFRVEKTQRLSAKLGHFLLHPFYGSMVALAVCYLIFYQMLGVWIAGNLVDVTERGIMRSHYEPVVRRLTALVFPSVISVGGRRFDFPHGTLSSPIMASKLEQALSGSRPQLARYNFWGSPSIMSFLGNALAGEYGVFTLTVTYLLGLLMPLVLGFYLGLSLLEDSGYLPRLAVLVDRVMNKIGLNGRAIIPLILGLGCVTMATITTRLLSTRREKVIATALLGVAIPCSAQLGVVSGTLARAGGGFAWAVYGVVVGAILAVTGLLLNMTMPGKSGALIIDLPPMRWPRLDNVLRKTWKKAFNFLRESIPMFALAGFVVTVAQVFGWLDMFIRILQPITVNWLNLPNDPRIATTFILGIVRRDFAAFGLTDVSMTAVQAVIAMIVITLFVPCIATVGVMIQERGPKIALAIWVGSWLCAFVIGGVLARVLPPLFHLVGA